jgi:photosystem II stability/assembly factor-like uncharacterized protein
MFHFISSAAALAGLAGAALLLSCSDTSEPTSTSPATSTIAKALSAPTLLQQQSGTLNRLQAISPINAQIAWASGTGGTFTVTRNGGATWKAGVVPGAEALEFRDVEAISGQEAYLLSAGTGTDARIYHTTDGGRTWQIQFKNRVDAQFFDCFAFWDATRGLVMVDAVEGQFPVRRTTNGRFWLDIGGRLPEAQAGEAAFAASGTCVATQGDDRAWIATGGAEKARILATTDGGDTWEAYETPIVQGTPASGIFTVAFRDATHGILAGGDLEQEDVRTRNVAVSSDGGKTWTRAANAPFKGAAFGLSYISGHDRGPNNKGVVITGPGGAAWSPDEGATWNRIPGVNNYWAVAFGNSSVGWLVGTEGRILKLIF